MDHFVLTLIIGAVEVLFVPWAAWVTVKIFESAQKIAVQETQSNAVNDKLEKMDEELGVLRDKIDTGFKDLLNAMRK